MTPGRIGTGWAAAVAGATASGLLGAAATMLDATVAVRSGLVGGSLLCAVLATLAVSGAAARRRHARLSGEFEAVSDRLLRLEGAPPPGIRHDPDVARDLEVLGRLVTDLAEAVDRQALRLDALDAAERARAAAPPAARRDEAGAAPGSPLPAPLDIPLARLPPPAAARPPAAAAAAGDPIRDGVSREGAILSAFDAGRIELFLQPAVTLPQRRPRLYEVLARLRLADEAVLAPGEFLPAIERSGSLLRLDEAVLARAIRIAGHLATRNSAASIACNVSPGTIRDPRALAALEARLAERPEAARRLVLELAQTHWASFGRAEADALGRLRRLGAGFSVDGVTELRVDWAALAGHGVTFVKVPVERLMQEGVAPALRQVLERGGVQLVAERVERDDAIPDLIEWDVPLAQGFAIERPRPVKSEILEPADPRATLPPEEEPPPSRSQTLAKVAMSYRDYLRRTG